MPAHSIFRSRTQIGDQLLVERYVPKKPQPEETVRIIAGLLRPTI